MLVTFIDELGYKKIILKSDQEAAILNLKTVKREMNQGRLSRVTRWRIKIVG